MFSMKLNVSALSDFFIVLPLTLLSFPQEHHRDRRFFGATYLFRAGDTAERKPSKAVARVTQSFPFVGFRPLTPNLFV